MDDAPQTEAPLTPAMPREILVAEDDAIYRHLLQTLLQRASFSVRTVANGRDALRIAQAQDAPRLLIFDWMMPGLSGIELCHRLRQERATRLYQYIILLTSKDAKADTVAGLEAGADDYLTKPVDYQELLARLRAGTRILELEDRLLNAQKEMEYLATHDSLTGLWNRLVWKKLLAAEFERAYRNATSVAVLMIDLDHFKSVNDTYGHSAGDALLNKIGDVLQSLVRAYDHVGRYGGEEFIVLAQELSRDAALDYAERIRSTLAQTAVMHEGSPISVTVSIGLAFADILQERSPDAMVRTADRALYRAKARGRNCVFLDAISNPANVELRECQPAHIT
ncbi:MAG: diguanylate cyclase [Candidatus Korobacteraceae bacterium]